VDLAWISRERSQSSACSSPLKGQLDLTRALLSRAPVRAPEGQRRKLKRRARSASTARARTRESLPTRSLKRGLLAVRAASARCATSVRGLLAVRGFGALRDVGARPGRGRHWKAMICSLGGRGIVNWGWVDGHEGRCWAAQPSASHGVCSGAWARLVSVVSLSSGDFDWGCTQRFRAPLGRPGQPHAGQ